MIISRVVCPGRKKDQVELPLSGNAAVRRFEHPDFPGRTVVPYLKSPNELCRFDTRY